jgi:hypothetical protein
MGCGDVIAPIRTQEFLVIIESNSSWVGKIDTFTVTSKPGENIRWFLVNKPGVCWHLTKTIELGMLRAYGSTPDFTYGWTLDEQKYPMWGDQNTVSPYGTIRGCIPTDAKY